MERETKSDRSRSAGTLPNTNGYNWWRSRVTALHPWVCRLIPRCRVYMLDHLANWLLFAPCEQALCPAHGPGPSSESDLRLLRRAKLNREHVHQGDPSH